MNIAEILKDAPAGTKLYSPIYGEVTLNSIDNDECPIIVTDECDNVTAFTADGRYYAEYLNAECLLFPSKDNRDWSTFKVEPKFPLTYAECCKMMSYTINDDNHWYGYQRMLLENLQKLLICRDAWWKVDNDWKPDWSEESDTWKYVIIRREDKILATEEVVIARTLAFRTEEIRDKFLETFRDLIEDCKELI